MSTGRYSIIDISTDDIHFMQNPAKFPKEVHGKMNNGMLPEEIYLISGEDNRGRTVRFGFCYSKEELFLVQVRSYKRVGR